MADLLLHMRDMYLSPFLVAAWSLITVGTLFFGFYSRRAHNRNRATLRKVQRALQKLESKNGRLWHEVMKSRASGDLYRANEITVTNAEVR